MNDLINGRDLLSSQHTDLCYGIACDDCSMCTEDGGCRVEEWIDRFPSADRPQGEWIYCEDEHGIDGYRCSNCGKHIPWDYQHKFIGFIDEYHTCPFCDARMKGADDE